MLNPVFARGENSREKAENSQNHGTLINAMIFYDEL